MSVHDKIENILNNIDMLEYAKLDCRQNTMLCASEQEETILRLADELKEYISSKNIKVNQIKKDDRFDKFLHIINRYL